MKNALLLITILGFSTAIAAQTKITFESDAIGSKGGATALWSGGSINVIANPTVSTTNPSSKVLHVIDNDYLPIYFSLALPAGSSTSYPYSKVKYKLCYVGANGGSDTDYPNMDVYSFPSNTTTYSASSALKLASSGWSGSTWGTATTGTWVLGEFAFSGSTLTTIPAGNLVLKIAKPKLEYLIDDIELIASPTNGTNIFTIENFESQTTGVTYTTSGATGATATVEADPANAAQKALHIVSNDNYDQFVNINVTLPAGRALSDYDRLYFDKYVVASSTVYKNFFVKVGTTTLYADSNYPSQGTNNVWQNKDYDLSGLDLSAITGNTFTLTLGISGPSLSYYIDNIKLSLKSSLTGLDQTNVKAMVVYCMGNSIQLGQQVNKAQLFDMNGRLLISGENTSSLDVKDLHHGIYILKAFVDGNAYITKVGYTGN